LPKFRWLRSFLTIRDPFLRSLDIRPAACRFKRPSTLDGKRLTYPAPSSMARAQYKLSNVEERPMFSLQGDRALVIGGTSGIGLAAAQALKAAGAMVTVVSRSGEKVARAKAALSVEGVVLDASSAADVEAFFASREPWKHVVVSVTADGKGPLRGMTMEDAQGSMNAKFWSAFNVARFGKFDPEGSLTFVSGQLSKRPRADAVLQGAINAAIEGMARGLALELAPLRVNVVSPGIVATPQHDAIPAAPREAFYKATAERLPARRIGAAEDVAQTILYLACNRFTTGATVRIDGGSTIC
jgi:NAD(P)-dependent dehydrogenase (short-subunit alcohol dehydrogenase family)